MAPALQGFVWFLAGLASNRAEPEEVNRAQAGSLIAAAALAALGLYAGLRLTEPIGHTPSRAELASSRKSLAAGYEEAFEKAVRNLDRARRAAKKGDFASHYRWAVAYTVMLRIRTLRDTGGKKGQPEPDDELLRIVDLCRDCAQSAREETLLDRFERGRVWANAGLGE